MYTEKDIKVGLVFNSKSKNIGDNDCTITNLSTHCVYYSWGKGANFPGNSNISLSKLLTELNTTNLIIIPNKNNNSEININYFKKTYLKV